MSLHGLLTVIIGVPNVHETAAYSADFGLTPGEGGWFSTSAGTTRARTSSGTCCGRRGTGGARGLFAWGPPPPSFLHPEDLAAMMTGGHSAR